MVGKVSLADKMRIQTLHEQFLGVKAIMAAYVDEGWQGLGTQNSEGDLPAWVAWAALFSAYFVDEFHFTQVIFLWVFL